MARLIEQKQYGELDYVHLSDYLIDMARRDRREVTSRLRTLLAHLLQWKYQPEKRTRSWQATLLEQSNKLADAIGTGVLRDHAEQVLPKAYEDAVRLAAVDTGLPASVFPTTCPYTLDKMLVPDILDN
jgi:hypothetical protein